MSKDKLETKRNFKRWNLNPKDAYEPESVQRGGIAVELLRDFIIDISLSHAVAKDISLGGVGLLVPAEKKIPKRFIVVFDEYSRLTGQIMYRRQINDKLIFLGVEWVTKNSNKRSVIVKRLQEKARVQEDKRVQTTKQFKQADY